MSNMPTIEEVYHRYKDLPLKEAIKKKMSEFNAPRCPLDEFESNSEEEIFEYFKMLEDVPLTKEELIHLYVRYSHKEFVKADGKPYSNPLDRIVYLMKKYKVVSYRTKHAQDKLKKKGKHNVKAKRVTRNKIQTQTIVNKEEKKLEELKEQLARQEAVIARKKGHLEKHIKIAKIKKIKDIDDSKPQVKPTIIDEESKKALKDKKVVFEPNPGPQEDFLASSEKDVLYGGQAGGGKSYALIVDPLRYASNRNHRALILRRSMPELRELIDKSRELYPQAFKGAKFKEVEKTWYFPSGAKIAFGYLEKDSDVYQFQGQAYSWIGYDELTHLSTEFPWQYLASRLRTTDPNLPTYMRATTNPGGPGHSWVKKRYIDPAPANESFIGADGIQRKFIPATLHDNPAIASDGQYEAMLKSLPEVHRKRLLEGDWDVNEGAAFAEFNSNIHVIDPFDIPSSWQRVKGVDYGYAAESACVWAAIDPNDGTLIVYRELYEKGLTGEDLAKKMTEFEEGEKRSIPGVLDTAAWNRTGYAGPTIGEILCSRPYNHQLRAADKNRISGKVQIHERLKIAESGRPKMQFFSTCINLIREITSIQYDKNKPEDVDTKMSDHAYDALRYLVMSRPQMETQEDLAFRFKQEAMFKPMDSRFGY